MNAPIIEVKNIKSFEASDGYAYYCAGYVNGKRAFLVENHGDGGETIFTALDPDLYQLAMTYAESLPDVECEGFENKIPSDLDLLVCQLIDRREEDKKLRRICKTKTLFRLPGDEAGKWRVYNIKFDKTAQNIIRYMHPNAEIANLRFS